MSSYARTANRDDRSFRDFVAKAGPTHDKITGVRIFKVNARSSLEAGLLLLDEIPDGYVLHELKDTLKTN